MLQPAPEGEVLGATWADIDLEERSIKVRRQVLIRGRTTSSAPRLYVRETTKGKRPRTVRFDPATAAALRAWRAQQASDRLAFGARWHTDGGLGLEAAWVATEGDGRVIHPDILGDRFARLSAAAGVRRIPLHSTRHTFATLGLAAGIRPDLVSRALGHASVSFTLDVYTYPSSDEEQHAADLLGAALNEEGADERPRVRSPFRLSPT